MRVGVFYADRGEPVHAACGAVMVQSVRQSLPGVHVVQFSDEASAPIAGVDEIVRGLSAPLSVMIARHYRECLGDWLFVDTDVVIQQDVRDVFLDREWQLAVAARSEHDPITAGRELWRTMPFNCGVIFSRSQACWTDVLDAVNAMPPDMQAFMGVQQAINDLVASGHYPCRILPPSYNYSPHREDEDLSGYAIAHFKGAGRKPWMLNRRLVAA